MNIIWAMALADHGHREPAGQLVTGQDPGRREQLQRAEDEGDPAPSAQIADHVMRVSDEEMRVAIAAMPSIS